MNIKTILVLSICLVSCQFRVPKDPYTLIEHLQADPSTLNPILVTDNSAAMVESYIFETLLTLDKETLEHKPMLAKSWNVSSDHLQYTFVLREDVKWHDGVPFTSQDVVYSYNTIKDPGVDAAVARAVIGDIAGVEALDKYTVRFTYSRPYFRGLLVCGGMPIIPSHVVTSNRAPIGTGAFIFKEWKTRQKIVLVQNPNYWGDLPQIRKIIFRIIEDPTVVLQELKKGEIDLAEVRAVQWERGIESKKIKKLEYYLPNYSFIGWNLKQPYFKDRRVRHALSMMTNKKAILSKLLFGHGVMVEGQQYVFGDAYDDSIRPDPYDPKGAATLLDEAGWIDHNGDGMRDKDGIMFKFEFIYAAGSIFASQLATILREDFLKAGIALEPRGLEFGALVKSLTDRQFDAATLQWTVPPDGDPYQVWHSSQGSNGSNYVGFANDEADKLIEAIQLEFNKDQRDNLHKKLQKILSDEQPYTFLFNHSSLVAFNSRLKNVKAYKMGVDVLKWKVE